MVDTVVDLVSILLENNMVPPFKIEQQYIEDSLDENIKLFFLNEGKCTEIGFYKKLFSKEVNFELDSTILVNIMKKTGKEEGLSDPIKMIDKAIEWAKENDGEEFDISKDKIVITFDLDVFDDDKLQKIIDKKTAYLIYVYSNPKFELPLLMATDSDLASLEQQYYMEKIPNKVLENAFSKVTHINSKTRKAGAYAATNYNKIISNKTYDKNTIELTDKFYTNINYLLRSLTNCDLKSINKF